MKTAEYYDNSNYADDELLRGTGVIGLISGDHLHPPMVDDPELWKHSQRWRDGAAQSVRRLVERAGIAPGTTVLDVGCGVGGTVRLLQREFAVRALGLNISETQIATARKLGPGAYVKGSITAIPIRANCLDAVTSINMFYHIADHATALGEMFRVLRPRGALAFDDWMLTENASDADQRELNTHWNPEPVRWIRDVELMDLLNQTGFAVEDITDLTGIGRGVMHEHFADTFEREVRPLIESADPRYGTAVADHFKAAVEHTIRMYREERMRYLQIVARKP
ncbi:MAG TPA: class I SAM-dependent methyltransferase [Longimicrobiales bacterium]